MVNLIAAALPLAERFSTMVLLMQPNLWGCFWWRGGTVPWLGAGSLPCAARQVGADDVLPNHPRVLLSPFQNSMPTKPMQKPKAERREHLLGQIHPVPALRVSHTAAYSPGSLQLGVSPKGKYRISSSLLDPRRSTIFLQSHTSLNHSS